MPSAIAANVQPPDAPEQGNPMKGPLTASMIFHIIVLALCIVGIPYFHHDLPELSDPMTVELARPDEIAQTNKEPAKVEPHPPPQQLEKPPPMPQMPQMTSPTPPKAVAPEKPPEVKEVKQEKTPDELALPQKKPAKPPKPDKKQPVKEKPDEQKENFQSLLRNLMPNEPKEVAKDTPDKVGKPSPHAKVAEAMTADEFAAVRQQISGCWSVIAGARYAEELVVDVKLYMNADRTVNSKMVLDQFRYASDSYYRAAADSALRALEDPNCNPLNLPPNKYEQWKVMTIQFDPKEMLQ